MGSNMASDVQLARSLPEKPSVLSPSVSQSSAVSSVADEPIFIFIIITRAALYGKIR